jgi:DNA-binding transcriptional ArsR family regulator
MSRLEIIHLRLSGSASRELIADIQQAIRTEDGAPAGRIYHHATVPGDLSIHLDIAPGTVGERLSVVVSRLARALKEHGMVEHTVWIEEPWPTKGEAP